MCNVIHIPQYSSINWHASNTFFNSLLLPFNMEINNNNNRIPLCYHFFDRYLCNIVLFVYYMNFIVEFLPLMKLCNWSAERQYRKKRTQFQSSASPSSSPYIHSRKLYYIYVPIPRENITNSFTFRNNLYYCYNHHYYHFGAPITISNRFKLHATGRELRTPNHRALFFYTRAPLIRDSRFL